MTTGHLDTTKYNAQVANAASQVKISSTVFKNFIADVKDKNDSNYDLLYADSENAIGMKRQALINGNFDVWQRGTSFTNPTTNTYTSDRWNVRYANAGTLPTTILHRQSSLAPSEIPGRNYYNLNVNGAGSGFGVSDYYELQQRVENGTRLLCGAVKKVTVSFWARSSVAGKKLGYSLYQQYGSGGSPSSAEIIKGDVVTLTSTFTKYTVTFTANTLVAKTFGTNLDDFIALNFWVMWGTTSASQQFSTYAVAESFGGSGDVDIAQVQVNAGDQALPFQPRSFAEELALCMRYYELLDSARVRVPDASTSFIFTRDFRPKRVAPTPTITTLAGNTLTINATRTNSIDLILTAPGSNQESTYTIKLDAEI